MDTYVAAIECAYQYNATNGNRRCEQHTRVERLERLSADSLGDEYTPASALHCYQAASLPGRFVIRLGN